MGKGAGRAWGWVAWEGRAAHGAGFGRGGGPRPAPPPPPPPRHSPTAYPPPALPAALQAYLWARAVLRPGDRVIVTWPSYQGLTEVAASLGCEVVRWEARYGEGAGGGHPSPSSSSSQPTGRPRFDVRDCLAALNAGGTRAVVCNFPHNPTGATLDGDSWAALLAACAAAGAHLLSDEMYAGLEARGRVPLAPAAGDAGGPLAASLGGLSKWAGARMGRVAGWSAMAGGWRAGGGRRCAAHPRSACPPVENF